MNSLRIRRKGIKMKKVAVVLSGCGVYDGAEIHESVITLLALDQRNADVKIFAPNVDQMHVVNHLNGQEMAEKRNVLTESARIARGAITDLQEAHAADFDAVIFPGGFGVAKNLCDFAVKGAHCEVEPSVERFVTNALTLKKALGFVCIAPALLAKIAGNLDIHPILTIGTEEETAEAIHQMGGYHISCPVKEFIVDEKNKIVTTPAYMLGQRISDVFEGIDKLVEKVLEIC